MIRIDEMEYLMHELSLLRYLRKLFNEKFPKVSRKEYKDKIMDIFNESDRTLRSMMMLKWRKINLSI